MGSAAKLSSGKRIKGCVGVRVPHCFSFGLSFSQLNLSVTLLHLHESPANRCAILGISVVSLPKQISARRRELAVIVQATPVDHLCNTEGLNHAGIIPLILELGKVLPDCSGSSLSIKVMSLYDTVAMLSATV